MSGQLMVATLFAGLLVAAAARADAPDFSGHWQIDPARSQQGQQQNLSLDIQEDSDKIVFTRRYRGDGGKEENAQFSCVVGGKECAFNENGRKATVSLWFDGPVLVILKTNGPKIDPTVEWHLSVGTDGKTLTVKRENMGSAGETENLVFNKAQSLANR